MRIRFPVATSVAFALTVAIAAEQSPGKNQAMLSCTPSVVRPGETVKLRFARRHPAELMVRRPDGTPLFLVYDRDQSMPPGLTPMMSKDVFRQLLELKLAVGSAEATPWVAGYDKNEQIFTRAGEYAFLLREVLETDADAHPNFRCRVTYQP
jgi:hypothetical protein